MPQAIKTAIYTKLISDTGASSLYTAVGGRIYEGAGKANASLPLLVYEVTTSNTQLIYGDDEIVDAVATFTLYGHRKDGLKALGDIEAKLYTLLNSSNMTTTGYDRGNVTATSRDVRLILEDVVSSQSVYMVTATAF